LQLLAFRSGYASDSAKSWRSAPLS
jgi:hypothetical protein